jgi:hypothetical protein
VINYRRLKYLLKFPQIWANLNKTPAEIIRNRVIGFLFLVVVCFFNTIPLFIISILANLTSVQFLTFCLVLGQLKDSSTDICLRGFPLGVVNCISGIFCCCFWCLASCYLGTFWFFPSHRHALVEQVPRCSIPQPVCLSCPLCLSRKF